MKSIEEYKRKVEELERKNQELTKQLYVATAMCSRNQPLADLGTKILQVVDTVKHLERKGIIKKILEDEKDCPF